MKKNDDKIKRSLFRILINSLILLFAITITLLIFTIGFTQTSTFRKYLKNEITNRVNANLNGKFTIGEINGSVLSSLILKDVTLTNTSDTIFTVKNIKIKLIPHKLIFNLLYFREIKINSATIKIFQTADKNWNIDKLFNHKNDIETSKAKTTTETNTPLAIQINDLDLTNINFRYTNYLYNANTIVNYDTVNWNDLLITNLNLKAKIDFEPADSVARIDLHHLNFRPNLNLFALKNLSGDFLLTPNSTIIKNFSLKTPQGNVQLNAYIKGLSFFKKNNYPEFKNYPTKIELLATPFNFSDLSSFLPNLSFLKGKPYLELNAEGLYGNLTIKKFKLKYKDSFFDIKGELKNLHKPNKLFINANLTKSKLKENNIKALLPDASIPVFKDLVLRNINAEFKGAPNNFNINFATKINSGKLTIFGKMDLSKAIEIYDLNVSSENLNLKNILNLSSSLNTTIKFKGKGFSQKNISAKLFGKIFNSTLENTTIDSTQLKIDLNNNHIAFFINSLFAKSNLSINGTYNTSTSTPTLYATGKIRNLNLNNFSNVNSLESNLNSTFTLSAYGMNIDSTKLSFNLTLNNSILNNQLLNKLSFGVKINTTSDTNTVNINSDFLTATLKGHFNFANLLLQASSFSEFYLSSVTNKFFTLTPLATISANNILSSTYSIPHNKSFQVKYKLNFSKSPFYRFIFGSKQSNFEGNLSGMFLSENNVIRFTNSTYIKTLTLLQNNSPLYISDLSSKSGIVFKQNYTSAKTSFSLKGKRIYSGFELNNFSLNLTLSDSLMNLASIFTLDSNLTADIISTAHFETGFNTLRFPQIKLTHNNIEWNNIDTLAIRADTNSFVIDNFSLKNNNSILSLQSILNADSTLKVKFTIDKVNSHILEKYFSFLDSKKLSTQVSLFGEIGGSLENPVMNFKFQTDSLFYLKQNYGSIFSDISYNSKKLVAKLFYSDSLKYKDRIKFYSEAEIPVNLSLINKNNSIEEEKNLFIKIHTSKFDLSSFGNTLPIIRNQKGTINSDIEIAGNINDLNYTGYIDFDNFVFNSRLNNLTYSSNGKITFNKKTAKILNFNISNTKDVNQIGDLLGNGEIQFQGFSPQKFALTLTGDLTILGQKSKIESPQFYGDLFVSTKAPIKLEIDENRKLLSGSLLLKKTDLVYSIEDSKIDENNSNIIYEYVVDSTKIDWEEIRYKKLIKATEEKIQKEIPTYYVPKIEYDLDINIDNDARLVFILSNVGNQKLIVEATGGFKYRTINGKPRAQGVFTLLSGSSLDFIKVFNATGSLRFESELSNPYLDITATYLSDYTPNYNSDATEQVAVKAKIKGQLSELGKSLTASSNNIAIYKGAQNIQNNVPDTKYDVSDVITFLLMNKFKEDLDLSDQTELANIYSTALSAVAGTLFSDFLNSSVGGIINNVQFSDAGQNYNNNSLAFKYTISGKYKQFKYTFGGNFEGGLSLQKSDFQVEYLFNPNFSIKVESRRPIGLNSDFKNKINELALKYKFLF